MGSYSDLPEEIIFNILSRVPAKFIGLCRCVSKPWRSLISQPDFIKTHLQMSKINSLESLAIVGIMNRNYGIYSAPLNDAHHLFDKITLPLTKLIFSGFNPNSVHFIYGSCDGLLLVVVGDNQGTVFVVNPVTKEIRQVPRSPFALNRHFGSRLYGFGFDSVNHDYKVIIISSAIETFVDVYSLKTGFWKRLESSPYRYVGVHGPPGVFVGGCLHWLARRTIDDKPVIVAFNLFDEKFREVAPPSLILNKYYLVEIGGCLCIYCGDVDAEFNEVWMMKEYGILESWTMFMVSSLRGWIECFLSGREQVVVQLAKGYRVMWNLKQGIMKEIVFNGFNDSPGVFHVDASFVESLVSPNGMNESERMSYGDE